MPAESAPVFPKFKWIFNTPDAVNAAKISRAYDLPTSIADLLVARGISTIADVENFLNPRLEQLSDPLEYPGITEAVDRIIHAIRHQEQIAVFGDFDADGVTATYVLTSGIRALGGQVVPFLPDRFNDGYGLTLSALQRCLTQHPQTKLLLTVDCGITAHDAATFLKKRNCDLIITDHHEPDATMPSACAIVTSKNPDVPENGTMLCGAGIAFKLVHALVKYGRLNHLDAAHTVDPRIWLDAVAVATIADVVPLYGENRVLVAYGLQRLQQRPSIGLKALLHRAGAGANLTSRDLAFILAPRLNAAGRMLDAWPAFNLLQSDEWDHAISLAVQMEQLNAHRRQTESEILKSALAQLGSPSQGPDTGGIVAADTDWHIGTIGIVASRLADLWSRPAAVVSLDKNGRGRGSVRARDDYDAHAALKSCARFFEGYGGHSQAGGFTLKPGALDDFRVAFNEVCCSQQPADGDLRPKLNVDGWIDGKKISLEKLWQAQQKLEPFGKDHEPPCWGIRNARLTQPAKCMGALRDHLSMSIAFGASVVRVVGWNMAELEPHINRTGKSCELAVTLAENHWNGETSIEMRLTDARPLTPP